MRFKISESRRNCVCPGLAAGPSPCSACCPGGKGMSCGANATIYNHPLAVLAAVDEIKTAVLGGQLVPRDILLTTRNAPAPRRRNQREHVNQQLDSYSSVVRVYTTSIPIFF